MPALTSQQLVPPPCTAGHVSWHCNRSSSCRTSRRRCCHCSPRCCCRHCFHHCSSSSCRGTSAVARRSRSRPRLTAAGAARWRTEAAGALLVGDAGTTCLASAARAAARPAARAASGRASAGAAAGAPTGAATAGAAAAAPAAGPRARARTRTRACVAAGVALREKHVEFPTRTCEHDAPREACGDGGSNGLHGSACTTCAAGASSPFASPRRSLLCGRRRRGLGHGRAMQHGSALPRSGR